MEPDHSSVTLKRTFHSSHPFQQSLTSLDNFNDTSVRVVKQRIRPDDVEPEETDVDAINLLQRKSLDVPEDYAKPPSPPEVKGILYRLDGLFGYFWLERFLCVQANRLCFYIVSRPFWACGLLDDFELEGDDSVSLSDIVSVEHVDPVRGLQNCFKVSLRTEPHEFIFHAESQGSVEWWVKELRTVAANAVRPDPLQERMLRLLSSSSSGSGSGGGLTPPTRSGVVSYGSTMYPPHSLSHPHPVKRGPSGTPRQVCVTGSYTIRDKAFPYLRHTRYWVTVTAFDITVDHRYSDFHELALALHKAGWCPDEESVTDSDSEYVGCLSWFHNAQVTQKFRRKLVRRIPRLPPKALFNMRYKFVKDRERRLNKFVQRVIAGTDALQVVYGDPLKNVSRSNPASRIIREFFLPQGRDVQDGQAGFQAGERGSGSEEDNGKECRKKDRKKESKENDKRKKTDGEGCSADGGGEGDSESNSRRTSETDGEMSSLLRPPHSHSHSPSCAH
eukprot:Rmarinus@m.15119